MLIITIIGTELFDEVTSTFSSTDDFELRLEHSLLSLSKWESKHQKPFLTADKKSPDEIMDYIRTMILNDEYPPDLFKRLSRENLNAINAYIESKESATILPQENRGRGETITSELIYFWMSSFHIDFIPTETWHLNRLFNLIGIHSVKNAPKKKMSAGEVARRNRDLNEQRRAKLGTRG